MKGHDNVSLVYVNEQLDVFVHNNPYAYLSDPTVTFRLNVTFFACGGIVGQSSEKTGEEENVEMSGVITSPNYGDGREYPNDVECLWVMRAPLGKIIQVFFFEIEKSNR